MRHTLSCLGAATVLALLLSGCTGAAPVVTPTSTPAAGPAAVALAGLPVAQRAPSADYSRDAFGQAWADVDRNGCDTRNDVLARDLADVVFRAGSVCVVAAGTLADPYTGATLPFLRGAVTSDDIQIDHVVALAAAWRTGAQGWDTATRTAFANDPLNLLAVDGDLNQAKGDSDAAAWLPPAAAGRCPYVARQIAVKQRYGAWVTPAERDAMVAVLAGCPGEPLPGPTLPEAGTLTVSTPTPVTAPSNPVPGDGCPVKGNVNGDGMRIYHLPGTRSYDETRIDADRGERWFCTEQDALDAGWRAPLG